MTNQRFTLHINWYNYEKTEGEAELKDNGQTIHISEDVEDMRRLKELLNELNNENTKLKQENIELKLQLDICKKPLFSKRQLHQENQHIKNTIRVMMENERTEIGKNTLRQLWEAIQ